jgi:hypothetical protein
MDFSMLDENYDIIPASDRERSFHSNAEINMLPELCDDNLPCQGLISPTLSSTLVTAASTRAETVADTNFNLSLLPVPKDGLVALNIRDDQPAR